MCLFGSVFLPVYFKFSLYFYGNMEIYKRLQER
jgi:hypothetical protein